MDKFKDVDKYLELQNDAFQLLKDIADMQVRAAKNAKDSRNVTDYDRYKVKMDLYFKGLSGAVTTLNSLLKNISSLSDLEAELKAIHNSLNKLKKA